MSEPSGKPVHWLVEDLTPAALGEIAGMLRRDALAILPTDTLYGLHAAAHSEVALQKLDSIKRRTTRKPFVVLIAEVAQLALLGYSGGEKLLDRLRRIWPAPLTAILPIDHAIPATASERTVAVRVPQVKWLRELLRLAGPLASTSLNHSGTLPVTSLESLDADLLSEVGAVVEGAVGDSPSTIIDLTSPEPRLVRAGAVEFRQNLWKKPRKIL